jgi:hypothetical protein
MLCSFCLNLPAVCVSQSCKVGRCKRCARDGGALQKFFADCLEAAGETPGGGLPQPVMQFSGTDAQHRGPIRGASPAELAVTAARRRALTLRRMGLGAPVMLSTGLTLDKGSCTVRTTQRRKERRQRLDPKVAAEVRRSLRAAGLSK